MKLNFVCVSLNPALSCMHSSCYPVARSAPTRPKWVWSAPAALLSVRVPFPSTPWKSACQHLGRTGRINRNRSRVVEWVARLSGGWHCVMRMDAPEKTVVATDYNLLNSTRRYILKVYCENYVSIYELFNSRLNR